jgi:predicted nucleotidyltransferase component of viral defense system
MKFAAANLQAIADATGFPPDNLEKVLRLRELLNEFHKHPFLRDRIVLKGGTAINLFYLDLVRLSVDIDLNYIAQVEREKMLAERPDVVRAVDQIATGLGYRIQNGVDDHALREWHLGYGNHTGAQDRIQVEINFLMRTCVLPPTNASSGERRRFPALRVSCFGHRGIVRGKTESHDRPPTSTRPTRPFSVCEIQSSP